MIKAKNANIISKEMSEKIVDNALKNEDILRDVEQLIMHSADMGCNYCVYSFDYKLRPSWNRIVLKKMEPLIEEFESAGYKLILTQIIHNNISVLYIRFYWGDSYEEYKNLMRDNNYGGEDGILYSSFDFFDEFH